MATIWKFTKFIIVLGIIILILWAVLANYSVIFSKTVAGEIIAVERIEIPVALVTRADSDITSKVFSFAIGIKNEKTGEIVTASSEDRQWAVAQKRTVRRGCVLAVSTLAIHQKGHVFWCTLSSSLRMS